MATRRCFHQFLGSRAPQILLNACSRFEKIALAESSKPTRPNIPAMPPEIIQRQPVFDVVPADRYLATRERRRPACMVGLQPQIVGSNPVGHRYQDISTLRGAAAHRVDHPIGPTGAKVQSIVA